jgi:chromosome segregation ATPase
MCYCCLHLQSRIKTLQGALTRAEQESERRGGLLAAAEAAAAAAKGREDSARAAGREYAERARRAETLHEEADAELAEVRGQRWRWWWWWWEGGKPLTLHTKWRRCSC